MGSVVASATGRPASAPPPDEFYAALAALRGDAVRVVLWGPSRSGRSTLLRNLSRAAMASSPVTCTSFAMPGAHLWWSDVPTSTGLVARYVAAEPEATEHGRRAALANAAVVVFVADSHPKRLEANRKSAEELLGLWSELHASEPPPTVILAVNKRDAELTLDAQVIVDSLAALSPVEVFETVGAMPKALGSLFEATTRAVLAATGARRRIAG
jgi:signal recognition particle receptor subunit beta